jgi:hypothetical protein
VGRLEHGGAFPAGDLRDMVSVPRLVAAAACFALALGLPFGRATQASRHPGAALAMPLLVTEPGTRGYGPGGEPLAIPGRLRMQYVPLFLPVWDSPSIAAPPGRTTAARVPLAALLAAALLAWRRRSPLLPRRAALLGAAALAATGVLAALPSTGAVVSILGIALLATIGAGARRAASSIAADAPGRGHPDLSQGR